MLEVGDVVTFTDTEPLWDANMCLISYKGNLTAKGYMKRYRPWLIMEVVMPRVSGFAEPLYILCPIVKDPNPHENEQGIELQDGTLGFVDHSGKSAESPDSNRFIHPIATLVNQQGTEYWMGFTKSKRAQSRHLNVRNHPDWPPLERAFWERWSGKGPLLLMQRFKELHGEGK